MSNLKIIIEYEKIKELEITPNQYVLAYCIHYNFKSEYLELIGSYKSECVKEDIFCLLEKGYLNNGNPENIYEIVFDKCEIIGIFNDLKDEPNIDSFEEFATKYRLTFPSGVISGNQYVRSSERDIQAKLKKFEKEYNYDRSTILKAAKNYVDRCKLKNYSYMKLAHFFIFKNNESALASECEAILQNADSDSESNSLFSETI